MLCLGDWVERCQYRVRTGSKRLCSKLDKQPECPKEFHESLCALTGMLDVQRVC